MVNRILKVEPGYQDACKGGVRLTEINRGCNLVAFAIRAGDFYLGSQRPRDPVKNVFSEGAPANAIKDN